MRLVVCWDHRLGRSSRSAAGERFVCRNQPEIIICGKFRREGTRRQIWYKEKRPENFLHPTKRVQNVAFPH